MTTKVIMLGCGTPNACFNASGPAVAITVDDQCYLFDCGPGVIRQIAKAYHNKVNALHITHIDKVFITHLHSDHTAGLADVILTPWVLERTNPLQVYGPKGIKKMCDCLLEAYQQDIKFRIHGFEQANTTGIQVHAHEVDEGLIYADERIQIEAFRVQHGEWPSFAYRCITKDKIILISGDTAPLDIMVEKAKGCDILIHEVFYREGLKNRDPQWQKYHAHVHTDAVALGKLAKQIQPRILVTYHRLYHMDMWDNTIELEKEMQRKDILIEKEIRQHYHGQLKMAHDLDVIE